MSCMYTCMALLSAPAGIFPDPQYVRTLVSQAGGTGVALIGDAAHAFPPDLGQGLNAGERPTCAIVSDLALISAALEDVVVLI